MLDTSGRIGAWFLPPSGETRRRSSQAAMRQMHGGTRDKSLFYSSPAPVLAPNTTRLLNHSGPLGLGSVAVTTPI